MKKQVKRLSPHQNGKVFGILMAVATLPMFLPMMLMMSFTSPGVDADGNSASFPTLMLLAFPFFYLIFGYISTVIMCFFYNVLQKYIGGFEYETVEPQVENT